MYWLDTERESLDCRPTGLSIPRPHGSFVAEIEHLSGESDEPDPSAHRKDSRDGGLARSDDRDAGCRVSGNFTRWEERPRLLRSKPRSATSRPLWVASTMAITLGRCPPVSAKSTGTVVAE